MKQSLVITTVSVLCLGAFGFVAGCKSQTAKSGQQLADQAETFQTQLAKMPSEIDATIERLRTATSGQNPKRADDFREYVKQVDRLKDRARLVGREANAAEVDSAKYFTAWAKAAQKAPSAERSTVRAAAATERANQARALGYLSKARDDFGALVTELDGVTGLLKSNLSEQSILAAQPMVDRAMNKALDVRNMIDRLDESINEALAAR